MDAQAGFSIFQKKGDLMDAKAGFVLTFQLVRVKSACLINLLKNSNFISVSRKEPFQQ